MICQFGSIALSTPPSCPSFAGTKGNIRKEKCRLSRKKQISARKLSMEFGISNKGVQRIMKNDLELRSYKIVMESLLSDDQGSKHKKIYQLGSDKFSKRRYPMRILCQDEKFFDIDGVYKTENDQM